MAKGNANQASSRSVSPDVAAKPLSRKLDFDNEPEPVDVSEHRRRPTKSQRLSKVEDWLPSSVVLDSAAKLNEQNKLDVPAHSPYAATPRQSEDAKSRDYEPTEYDPKDREPVEREPVEYDEDDSADSQSADSDASTVKAPQQNLSSLAQQLQSLEEEGDYGSEVSDADDTTIQPEYNPTSRLFDEVDQEFADSEWGDTGPGIYMYNQQHGTKYTCNELKIMKSLEFTCKIWTVKCVSEVIKGDLCPKEIKPPLKPQPLHPSKWDKQIVFTLRKIAARCTAQWTCFRLMRTMVGRCHSNPDVEVPWVIAADAEAVLAQLVKEGAKPRTTEDVRKGDTDAAREAKALAGKPMVYPTYTYPDKDWMAVVARGGL